MKEILSKKTSSKIKAKAQPKRLAKRIKPSAKKIPRISSDLVELFPYGIISGLSHVKPIFLFKDKQEKDFLPIWLDSAEADVIQHFFQPQPSKNHPYVSHLRIFEKMGYVADRLVFNGFEGFRVYASLYFKSLESSKEICVSERAEDLICLALFARIRTFVTKKVLKESKEIKDVDLMKSFDQSVSSYNRDLQKFLV